MVSVARSFDQLSPTWGWKRLLLHRFLFQCRSFDQLSPTWGWKRQHLVNIIHLATKPSFDQLSPTWGWKPESFLSRASFFFIVHFRSTLPNLGMETLLVLAYCSLSMLLSINSPQPGDGNWMRELRQRRKFRLHFRSTLPNLGMETIVVHLRVER